MKLASILPKEAVFARIDARDKKQVLKALAAPAGEMTGLSEREIYSVLMERENAGCTGMGNGVCIPHGRFEKLSRLHAFFARLDHAVDFGSADGRPVDLVFVLLTPPSSNTEHIKALSLISKLLRSKDICKALREADSPEALHALLVADRKDSAV